MCKRLWETILIIKSQVTCANNSSKQFTCARNVMLEQRIPRNVGLPFMNQKIANCEGQKQSSMTVNSINCSCKQIDCISNF